MSIYGPWVRVIGIDPAGEVTKVIHEWREARIDMWVREFTLRGWSVTVERNT